MIESFWNRNAIVIGEKNDNQPISWKIISFFKWKLNSLLTEKQVSEWYYHSSEKGITKLSDRDKVLEDFVDDILNKIEVIFSKLQTIHDYDDIKNNIESKDFDLLNYILKNKLVNKKYISKIIKVFDSIETKQMIMKSLRG